MCVLTSSGLAVDVEGLGVGVDVDGPSSTRRLFRDDGASGISGVVDVGLIGWPDEEYYSVDKRERKKEASSLRAYILVPEAIRKNSFRHNEDRLFGKNLNFY